MQGSIKVPVISSRASWMRWWCLEQTRAMLAALQANGIQAEGHFYAGERHGFRKAENLAHALEESGICSCPGVERDEVSGRNRGRPENLIAWR